MDLYKRSNSPFWWYDFTIDGERFRESTKRPHSDKKGARAVMMAEYQKKVDRIQLGHLPEITLKEAFETSLSNVTNDQTKRVYRSAYKTLYGFCPNGQDTLAHKFTQDMLEDFLDWRREEGMAKNTLKADIRAFRRAFNRLEKRYLVPDLEYPSIKGFTKTRYLTDQEETMVFTKLGEMDNVTAEKCIDLMTLLIDTGVRLMEGVKLEWVDIDLSRRQIEVYRSKTKTLSLVPISQRVYDMLKRRHNQDRPFENMEWAIKVLRKVIRDNCNKSERIVDTRGRATVHSLRDTFASRMVQRGLSIQKLSSLLGHTNIQQTMKYAHVEKADVVDEARALLDG